MILIYQFLGDFLVRLQTALERLHMADPSGGRLQVIFHLGDVVFELFILAGSQFDHSPGEDYADSCF